VAAEVDLACRGKVSEGVDWGGGGGCWGLGCNKDYDERSDEWKVVSYTSGCYTAVASLLVQSHQSQKG